jgi:hypothetical protein
MARFLRQNIPVIHLGNIKELAAQYDLPAAPTSLPEIGEGKVYYERAYNIWLTGAALLGIVFGLCGFSRADWRFRMFLASARKEEAGPPEPMV